MKRTLPLAPALLLAIAASPALAQATLDYRAAEMAMQATPAGGAAAEADVRAAEHQAKAVEHLYRPHDHRLGIGHSLREIAEP